MKINNVNVVLTTVAAVLFLFAFWMNDPFSLFVSSYETSDPLMKTISLHKVDKIRLEKEGKILLVFDKKSDSGNSWFVTNPTIKSEYRADANIIQKGFDNLMGIRKYQEVTSNQKKHAQFEVDKESGFKVSFSKESADKPFFSIFLGKSGAKFNSTLVRLMGTDSIYSAKGNLKSDWEQTIDHFRDKSLLDLVPENIDSYVLSGAQNYTVIKNKLKEWEIKSDLVPVPVLSKQDKIKDILKKICDLEANSFPDLKTKLPRKKYANIDLLLANKNKINLTVFGPDAEDMYFVKSSQRSFGAFLAKWKIDDIVVKFDEIKDTKEKTPQIPTK